MLCSRELNSSRLFRFCLRAQVANKHGLRFMPLARPGRVLFSTVASTASPASANRLVSLPRQPKLESRPHDERGHVEVFEAQHRPFPATMRTSPANVARPLVWPLASGSLGGSHTQPANSGLAAYGWCVGAWGY
ncbi:hypothetical protein Vretimale_8259 [Volvox reticuliferus]|uniref:Uncharacterized protein n=2 Tax=Volvox reticuliferus TaxID=1737510 RepID=A0A8J4GAD7_9CHLO|nr:hypothetical protein Vretimale_8259 [Volvox reticuliferus]